MRQLKITSCVLNASRSLIDLSIPNSSRPIQEVAKDIHLILKNFSVEKERIESFAQLAQSYMKQIDLDTIISKEKRKAEPGKLLRHIAHDNHNNEDIGFQIVCFVLGDGSLSPIRTCIHNHRKSCGGIVRELEEGNGALIERQFKEIQDKKDHTHRYVIRTHEIQRTLESAGIDSLGEKGDYIHQIVFTGKHAVLLHLYLVSDCHPNLYSEFIEKKE